MIATFSVSQTQILLVVKQQLHTADNVDLRRLLSVADKPINKDNILATPGLWEYKQTLTLSAVQNMLTTMPPEVCGICGLKRKMCDAIVDKYLYRNLLICLATSF